MMQRTPAEIRQDTENFLLAGFSDYEAAAWLGCHYKAVEKCVASLKLLHSAHTRAQLGAILERRNVKLPANK